MTCKFFFLFCLLWWATADAADPPVGDTLKVVEESVSIKRSKTGYAIDFDCRADVTNVSDLVLTDIRIMIQLYWKNGSPMTRGVYYPQRDISPGKTIKFRAKMRVYDVYARKVPLDPAYDFLLSFNVVGPTAVQKMSWGGVKLNRKKRPGH